MMRRVVAQILMIVLAALAAGAAMAQPVCDLTDRVAHPIIDADSFFSRPRGTIALGGGCDTGADLCTGYIDISNCAQVLYPPAASGAANKLFVAINTVATCPEECELVDSFLAAGLLFDHAKARSDWAAFADLTRNYSPRWSQYLNSALARQSCCDRLVPPPVFIDAQGDARQPQDFVNRTGQHWHSAYEHAVRRDVLTWSFRDFFTASLERCGETCSIKAYLLRFQERAATDGNRPANPLLPSASLMDFETVRLQTMVPFGGDAYRHDVVIHLLR